MQFNEILNKAISKGASDIHISENDKIMLRIDGQLVDSGFPLPNHDDMLAFEHGIAGENVISAFRKKGEMDFAVSIEGYVRLRCNFYRCLGRDSMSVRLLPEIIPTAEQLGLPKELVDLCDKAKGLILVTGATGSGKSTTLAAMLDYINSKYCKHIVTLEDPVEYIHQNRCAMIHHREIGNDTASFADGIRAVLRQDPDVIMVGEMRDLETIATAISAAESGHLVLATLHTSSAASSVDRIIDAFPGDEQHQIRIQLADTLLGIVSQTLVPQADGGRTAAFELMLNSTAVQSMIREGKTYQLPSVIQTNKANGMFFTDDYLVKLCRDNTITLETALRYSGNRERVEEILCPKIEPEKNKISLKGMLKHEDKSK